MRLSFMMAACVLFTSVVAHAESKTMADLKFLETVDSTIERLAQSADDLPAQRKELLGNAVDFVARKLAAGEPAKLTFICTHNSRRSHLAQIWAQVAAHFYQLPNVSTYSGGTEATTCNIRTVRALRRCGLQVVATTEGDNPVYLVQYAENRKPLDVYSKVYDDAPNPQADYAAMMCCADVDERCPVVHGSAVRIALHYVDPKVSDDTPEEASTYDQRSQQIGQEMFYIMSQVSKRLAD